MRRPLLLVVAALGLVVLLGLGGLWLSRSRAAAADADLRDLFASRIPTLGIALHRGVNAEQEMARALEVAERWPDVAEGLRSIAAASPDPVQVGRHVEALNDALWANELPFWVDGVEINGRRALLTYEVVGLSTWTTDDGREVQVRQVRRLDGTNVEMGLVGHAGGGRPLVLVDRLEPLIIASLLDAYERPEDVPEHERAWRNAWRGSVETLVEPARLQRAAAVLRERDELFHDLTSAATKGRRLDPPGAFVWSDDFFDTYAQHFGRKRGGALQAANAKVASPEVLPVLDQLLALEAQLTEAHEVHHVLTPEDAEPAAAVVALVGEDDLRFSRMADRELRAYLGQLHDGPGPRCVTLSQLVAQATLPSSRRTAHDYASKALLHALDPAEGAGRDDAARLERLCRLPEPELQARAAEAWRALYGSDFTSAKPMDTQPSLARAQP